MPIAFLQPDSRLLRACQESTVLTSNERLRRELVRGYDHHQQSSGRRAWRSANVHSFEGYLGSQYSRWRACQPELPRLLSPAAELLLFQQVAPERARAMSRVALQAWNLAHAWGVPLTTDAFDHTDNGRVFLAWAERVRERLTTTASLTRSELPALLAGQPVEPAGEFVCLGFESVTRAAQGYFDALTEAGVGVQFRTPPATTPRSVLRTEFPAAAAELAGAAQWCRAILESSADARIGVVVPNLTHHYHRVVRQFAAELDEFAGVGKPTGFDVAAGLSLGEQPIWRAAHSLLALCAGEALSCAEAGRLLDSRYLDLPGSLPTTSERPARLTLWRLAALTGEPAFETLNRMCPPPDSQATFTDWLAHFRALLDAAGWTGSRAASGQYQAWEQLQSVLRQVAAAPLGDVRSTAATALSLLRQTLEAQIFAPRTAAAPVQIMGYLETTGLRFSHLWVTGMQDTSWPGAPNTNPFIPVSTQRDYAIPRIDQVTELGFVQSRMAHWLGASGHVVFSHAVDDGEVQHLPSPLTNYLTPTPVTSVIPRWRPRSHPYLVSRQSTLAGFDDAHGTALDPGRRVGGSGLLRDQAACPFRAWAIHRLGLREIRMETEFPDALDRGNLIHAALQWLLTDPAADQPAPRHPHQVTDADVAMAADAALTGYYERFPEPFRLHERERLIGLLSKWLELERKRGDFQVLSLESAAQLEVGGLTLSLRLDRVDRVAGQMLVIDYKTGRTRPGGLVSERLLEPQLPAYAASHDAVRGVLFAQVDNINPRLIGVADPALDLGPARLEQLPGESWDELASRWQAQLQSLAEEFMKGHAPVTPAQSGTCEQCRCHLQPVCRIRSTDQVR